MNNDLLLRVGVAFKLKVIGKRVAVNIPIDLMAQHLEKEHVLSYYQDYVLRTCGRTCWP